MKKICSVITVFLMIVSFSLPAFTEGYKLDEKQKINVSAGNVSAAPGEVFAVPVQISGTGLNIYSFAIHLSYDRTVLEPVYEESNSSVVRSENTLPENFECITTASGGLCRIVADGVDTAITSECTVTLYFRGKDSAGGVSTEIKPVVDGYTSTFFSTVTDDGSYAYVDAGNISCSAEIVSFSSIDCEYTITAIDEDNGNILQRMTETAQFGEVISPEDISLTFDGYIRTGDSGKITIGKKTNAVTINYTTDVMGTDDPLLGDGTPDRYQKKIIFSCENGTFGDGSTEVVKVVNLTDSNGQLSAEGWGTVTLPATDSPSSGYGSGTWSGITDLSTVTVTGNAEEEYIYTYSPILFPLTIHYVFSTGMQAAEDYTGEYMAGQTYSITSPVIEGYSTADPCVTGTMEEKHTTLYVKYKSASEANYYTLTAHFVYEDGTKAADDYVAYITEGCDYVMRSPKIKGCDPSQSIIYGTSIAADIEITITYVENSLITEDYIPDARFREALSSIYPDGLTVKEAAEIEELGVDNLDISSLQGIEYFTNLKKLTCTGNNLTSLDVNDCVYLQELNCESNKISKLGINRCPELMTIRCGFNRLQSLDFRANTNIKIIDCNNNDLTGLNIDNCVNLIYLDCGNTFSYYYMFANKLTTLNVSDNTNLTRLYCEGNQITELALDNCPSLKCLRCDENYIRELNLSSCTSLELLSCSSNCITTLTIDSAAPLESLYFYNNQISDFDFNLYPSLGSIDCRYNHLISVDASRCTSLRYLHCDGNRIVDLKLPEEFGSLSASENCLPCLNVSEQLQNLDCDLDDNNVEYTPGTDGVIQVADLVGQENLSRVTLTSEGTYDVETGIVTLPESADSFSYTYDVRTDKSVQLYVNVTICREKDYGILTSENFPDAHFLADLKSLYPNGLTEDEASKKVKVLYIDGDNISSLEGIEFFSSLEDLSCENNQLTELNVSSLKELERLLCGYNRLTELNVNNLKKLENLDCTDNRLKTLELNHCTELKELDCDDNELTELNIADCSSLELLYCYENRLTELDLSYCGNLTELDCSRNNLKSINLKNCISLEYLNCERNRLEELKTVNCGALTVLFCNYNNLTELDLNRCSCLNYLHCIQNNLKNLDITNCTELSNLDCSGNNLSVINISGLVYSMNDYVKYASNYLNCSNNQLTELNLDGCSDLEYLYCSNNQLTELNLDGCSDLEYLYCSDNQLTELNLESCSNLDVLYCSANQFTELNLDGCSSLRGLKCSANQLTELNLKSCSDLEDLYCSNNQLTELNLESCSNLEDLYCSDNQLTTLNLDGCSELFDLDCSANQLMALNLDGYSRLYALNCSANQLTTLNLEGCSALYDDNIIGYLITESCPEPAKLDCSGNQLTTLNLDGCSGLRSLYCRGNQLTELNLEGCSRLYNLYCSDNQLLSLSLEGCTSLMTLDCSGNRLIKTNLESSELSEVYGSGQCSDFATFDKKTVDMTKYVGSENLSRISVVSSGTYDSTTGIVTLNEELENFIYEYDITGSNEYKITVNASVYLLIPELKLSEEENINAYCNGISMDTTSGVLYASACAPGDIITVCGNNTTSGDPHEVYPTSLTVYTVEELFNERSFKELEAASELIGYNGASIRCTGNQGMRIEYSIPYEKLIGLTSGNSIDGYRLQKFGTVATWYESGYEPVLGSAAGMSAYAYCAQENYLDEELGFSDDGTQWIYANAFIFTNMERTVPDLAIRPYAELISPQGETVTVYGGITVRNIGYVAQQCKDEFPEGSDEDDFIEKIISYVYATN